MNTALLDDGYDPAFVMLNGPDDIWPEKLGTQASWPIFQDNHAVEAWQMHGGTKDDIIVYNADLTVHTFFHYGGAVNTNLSTADGYQNLLDAVLDALGATP